MDEDRAIVRALRTVARACRETEVEFSPNAPLLALARVLDDAAEELNTTRERATIERSVVEIEAIALRERTEIVAMLRGAGHTRAADIIETFRGPTGLMSERIAIVSWLRKRVAPRYTAIADAIERGEHWPTEHHES